MLSACHCQYLYLSRIFANKARSSPLSYTRVESILACIYWTKVEVTESANTLAYYSAEEIKALKSFMFQALLRPSYK
jgi:hypothetical protein